MAQRQVVQTPSQLQPGPISALKGGELGPRRVWQLQSRFGTSHSQINIIFEGSWVKLDDTLF